MSTKVTLDSTQLYTLHALVTLERQALITKLQHCIDGEQFAKAKITIEHIDRVTTLRDVLDQGIKAARVTPIDPPAERKPEADARNLPGNPWNAGPPSGLQSKVPPNVYWQADNQEFYTKTELALMGGDFKVKWLARRSEFTPMPRELTRYIGNAVGTAGEVGEWDQRKAEAIARHNAQADPVRPIPDHELARSVLPDPYSDPEGVGHYRG